jgi:hypothetical protein
MKIFCPQFEDVVHLLEVKNNPSLYWDGIAF